MRWRKVFGFRLVPEEFLGTITVSKLIVFSGKLSEKEEQKDLCAPKAGAHRLIALERERSTAEVRQKCDQEIHRRYTLICSLCFLTRPCGATRAL